MPHLPIIIELQQFDMVFKKMPHQPIIIIIRDCIGFVAKLVLFYFVTVSDVTAVVTMPLTQNSSIPMMEVTNTSVSIFQNAF